MSARLVTGASPIAGRGVFTTTAIPAGAHVETCPVLVVPAAQVPAIDATVLYDHYYAWADGAAAIALGHGSLYNHSDDPNCEYVKRFAEAVVLIRARRAIPAGAELTIDYTSDPLGVDELWFAPAR